MMDAVNYPINMAAVALVKGLIYDEKNLRNSVGCFNTLLYDKMMEGKAQSNLYGLNRCI